MNAPSLLYSALWLRLVIVSIGYVLAVHPSVLLAQIAFETAPIRYSKTAANGPVSRLQQRLDSGEWKLEYDDTHGYLRSVLKALDIPQASQMLVFSKTSLQLRRISPRSPRALYYNDNVYVGWVIGGDVIEVSSVDPQQGAIFYTLRQEATDSPRFVRDQGNCLTCHASSRTQGVPGHLARSVYPSISGQPHFGAGTFNTNHTSPLSKRWGGWYVTGTHGDQRHMGNVISEDRDRPERLDVDSGANVTDLLPLTSAERYLTPHSDIVSLLVHDHQTYMHNLITYANYETRMALHQCAIMNEALNRPDEYLSESAQRRIRRAADKVVSGLLFEDEPALTSKVKGTTDYAREFAARGPRDARGRSLRELDLNKRLFRYPCSYLIYSESLNQLPVPVKDLVYERLYSILRSRESQEKEEHPQLSKADRQAIFEILLETHQNLPASWKDEP